MNAKALIKLASTIFLCALILGGPRMSAQETTHKRLVRIAEIEIDPAHLNAYKVALRAEIEASIRLEPGVLSLYAVAIKGHPNEIRLFEVYADDNAYQAHLQSAHFLRYKHETIGMVRSLKLIETEPLMLGSK